MYTRFLFSPPSASPISIQSDDHYTIPERAQRQPSPDKPRRRFTTTTFTTFATFTTFTTTTEAFQEGNAGTCGTRGQAASCYLYNAMSILMRNPPIQPTNPSSHPTSFPTPPHRRYYPTVPSFVIKHPYPYCLIPSGTTRSPFSRPPPPPLSFSFFCSLIEIIVPLPL